MKRQLTRVTLICGLLWSSEGVVVMADERTAPPLLPPQERQNSAQVATKFASYRVFTDVNTSADNEIDLYSTGSEEIFIAVGIPNPILTPVLAQYQKGNPISLGRGQVQWLFEVFDFANFEQALGKIGYERY